jgi:hypothetical protein
MSANNYQNTINYQMLIKTANDNWLTSSPSSDPSVLGNLISVEKEIKTDKQLIKFNIQLEKVKTNISKALIKLSKNKKFNSNAEFFIEVNKSLKNVDSTTQLIFIINESIEKIRN